VATKLAIIRSFFSYQHAGGHIPVNPAATKLVTLPSLPETQTGHALTKREARNLLAGPDRETPDGARLRADARHAQALAVTRRGSLPATLVNCLERALDA
jgi:site-specific recombinase XerD